MAALAAPDWPAGIAVEFGGITDGVAHFAGEALVADRIAAVDDAAVLGRR